MLGSAAHPYRRPMLATEHSDFDSGAERIAFAMAQRCALPLRGVLPMLSNAEYEAVAPQLAERAEAAVAARLAELAATAASWWCGADRRCRARSWTRPRPARPT